MKKLTLGLAIVLSVVMLLSCGVFATEAENAVEFLLPVGKPEVTVAGMTDDVENADIIVCDVYSDGFFKSGMDAEVTVYFASPMMDSKDKLKLSVVDEDGNTVANQVGCSFDYESGSSYCLIYKLQTVSNATLSYENMYSLKLSYSGSYTFACTAEYLDIYPMLETRIIRVDALDIANGVFFVRVANVDESATYYMTYNGSEPVEVDAKKGGFIVDFDRYDSNVSMYDMMYCNFELYTMSEYGYPENLSNYSQPYEGDSKGPYRDDEYNGVNFPGKISASAKSIFVYADWNDGVSNYGANDSGVATLYNAAGEVVGSGVLEPYYDDYDGGYYMLDGEVMITKPLNVDSKYYLVTDDGYKARINTVNVTSQPVFGYIGVQYKNENSYSHDMPTADTVKGIVFEAANVTDASKLSVKIVERGSDIVVYDMVPGSAKMDSEDQISFSLERKTAVSPEKSYVLYAYYNGFEIESFNMYVEGNYEGGVYIAVVTCAQTETATYIMAMSDNTGFNPKNVTYKLESADGTVKTLSYDRELWNNGVYSYYILKINESIDFSMYQWVLTVSDSTGVIATETYLFPDFKKEPFTYDSIVNVDGYVHIFGEGLSDDASYAINFMDANTGSEVTLPVTKVRGEGTLKIKSDATSKYAVEEYAPFILTANDSPVSFVDSWYFKTGSAEKYTAFYPTYNGQNHKIALLNLPAAAYTQYKLADSEEGLASASYKAITKSLVYVLPGDDGQQVVYAQFKDASGKESAVRMASIVVDASKPVISDLTNVPEKFVATDTYWGELQIDLSFTVTAGEEGEITFYLSDENDNVVSSYYTYPVSEGVNNIRRVMYVEGEELTAKKLVVYMTDAAGNKSAELSAPCQIVEKHSKYTIGKTTYFVNNETGAIDSVDSTDTIVNVPATLGGKPVTFINSNAFAEEYSIKKIVLPESITTIAMGAFSNMYLEEINIPSKVTILSDSLFMNTRSLKKLMLPAGLKTIEYGVFSNFTSCPAIYFGGTKAQWDAVSIASGGNSIIYGDYATIYFAEGSADIKEVYDEGHGNDGMLVIEATLGADTGMKTILVNGSELYFSLQRGVYVGLVSEDKVSGNAIDGIVILDQQPSGFIYGNAHGDYDIDSYDEAVDSADLQALKLSLKGTKKLSDMNLIASDVDGDGLCDSSDIQAVKLHIKSNKVFSILR